MAKKPKIKGPPPNQFRWWWQLFGWHQYGTQSTHSVGQRWSAYLPAWPTIKITRPLP